MERRQFVASLVAGGCAGMCVDLTLFPLDTIKTRLQSQQGFYKAGGFRGIYAGVPSAAVGSFPNGGVSHPGPHRGDQTENPGFSLIHHLPHTAGHAQRRGSSRIVQRIWEYSRQRDPVLTGAVSTLGIFKGSVVVEARSHTLLLAGCSVRSFCRCRGGICYHSSRRCEDQDHAREGRVDHSQRQHPGGSLRRVEEPRPHGSVCGQHTQGDLHQRGRVHLPGSLREGPPHFAVAARPL
uniref:Mitochondrial S-adenosylmethionine carrier protein n=1 Tax=Scophthalmus maximus TaxID=52904 RepID=A0A8D3DMH4_SCOMX